jgi:hypothetical protein
MPALQGNESLLPKTALEPIRNGAAVNRHVVLAVLAVVTVRSPGAVGAEGDPIDWSNPRWLLRPGPNYPGGLTRPVPLSSEAAHAPAILLQGKDRQTLTLRPINAAYSILFDQKLPLPHRLQYDFRGLGAMTSCVVSVQCRKHWQGDAGLVSLYANDKRQSAHPMGWHQASASVEYRPATWYRVAIENYADYSSVQIRERDSDLLLIDCDHVSHEPVTTGQLVLAKVGEKGPVTIEFAAVTLQTALSPPPTPIPPAPDPGYHLLFHDPFAGQATRWGSPRYLPGVLTLPKRTYFAPSYPVCVPDLTFSDGIIETEVLPGGKSQGEIRFRVNAFGDGYYAFTFGADLPGQFIRSVDLSKRAEPIGKSFGPGCRRGRRTKIRLLAEGPRLSAEIDGQPAAAATDNTHTVGAICLAGSEAAPVAFDTFTVFAKDGSRGEWNPRPLDAPASRPDQAPRKPSSTRPTTTRPLPPIRSPRTDERQMTDATGHVHRYAMRQGILVYDGLEFIPMRDSDGQYVVLYEPDRWPPKAWDRLRCSDTLHDLERYGLTCPIVRLRLADYVDCTQEGHGFHEDGGIGGRSRILQLGNDEYRVTACRKSLPPYFVYSTAFESVNRPHVVACQVPNDRERYLSVNPIPAETGSGGVYTGGHYPVDGKSRLQMHLYYPPQDRVEWVFMHAIIDPKVRDGLSWAPESGAAVANFWTLELLDNPADTRPVVHPPKGPQRRIGVLEQHATYLFRNYGVQVDARRPTTEQRQAAFAAWLDYLRMTGCDLPDLQWLGVDWMIVGYNDRVGYESELFSPYRKTNENLPVELLPAVRARAMVSYPSLASFNINDDERAKFGLTDEDILINREGDTARLFGQSRLDPTSDRVKDLFVRIVDELAGKVSADPAVPGISISIDGFFTLNDELGYGPHTLRRYRDRTRTEVPARTAAEAHTWIHSDPQRLERWQTWRCAEMHTLLTRLRDTLRKHRPDWVLKVKLMNKRTMQLLRTTDDESLQLLLGQGINPKLYANEPGICFVVRLNYESKPKNREGTAGFNFTHGVADVPTRHGTGLHQWTGYWEQAGVFTCLSRYSIGWLASANLVPPGRHILETATYHLRVGNIRELQYQTWERGIGGWEHLMRRFAAAFRSLPVAEPRRFEGAVEVSSGPTADETLWVAWYADRLAVLNDHPAPRCIRLRLPESLTGQGKIMELSRSRTLDVRDGWATLELAAFDLLVLGHSRQKE